MDCNKCHKHFTVTSWTRDRYWRGVCPRCIVETLEKFLSSATAEVRKEFGRK